MALSKYDIFLMLRAQDRASATLRRVSGDLRGLAGATATADTAAYRLQRRWDQVGRAGTILRDTGRSARLFGLAAGGAVAYAAYQFAQLDSQATLVATQMGKTNRTFQDTVRDAHNIRSSVVATMRDSTSSMQDLTATAYDLYSSLNSSGKAFLTFRDGQKILKLISDAAIASQTNIRDVAQGVISTMNAFGVSADQLPQVMNRLFAAVRFGRMTFGQFAQTLTVTAPAAKAANQSIDTMAGTMAFLTRRLDPRKAAVGFARLTEILSRPQMVEGLKKLGINITDTHHRLLQLPDVIQTIVQHLPFLTKGGIELTNFFKRVGGQTGTIQARRAFVFLATQLSAYRTILGATTTDNNEFNKSLQAMNQTLGVRWAKFINRLKADILDLGQRAIPAIMKIVAPIERLVNAFEGLSPHTKTMIVSWTAWGAAAAIVLGTIGSLAGGLLNLIAIFGKWSRISGVGLVLMASIAAAFLRGETAMQAFGNAAHYATQAFSHFLDFAGSGWKQFLISIAATGLITRKMFGGRGGAAGEGGMFAALLPFGILPKLRTFATSYKATFAELAGLGAARAIMPREIFSRTQGRYVQEAAQGASRFSRALQLGGAAALALPTSLTVTAGLVGAAGVAAYAWHLHMNKVRKDSELIKEGMAQTLAFADRLQARFQQFARLPDTIVNLAANRASLRSLDQQITEMRKKGAGAADPALQSLLAQRADLLASIRHDVTLVNRAMQNFSRGRLTGAGDIDKIKQKLEGAEQTLTRLNRHRDLLFMQMPQRKGQPAFWQDWERTTNAIDAAHRQVVIYERSLKEARGMKLPGEANLRKVLREYIQRLQDLYLLPADLPARTVKQIIDAMIAGQRILSVKQLRAYLKVALDLPSVEAALRSLESISKVFSVLGMGNPFAGIEKALRKAGKAGKELNAILHPPKGKKPMDDYDKMIAAYIKALEDGNTTGGNAVNGLSQKQIDAAQKVIDAYQKQQQAVEQYTQTLQSAYDSIAGTNKSAMGDFITGSQFFQSGIGNILMGVQQQIMAFTPTWKTIFSPEMILTAAKQQLDAFKRWRRDITKATKGMPEEMRQQLIALGPQQGAPILEAIMRMTPAQKRKLIGYFKQGQKELNRATKQDFNRELRYWKSLGKNIFEAIMQGMTPDQARVHKWVVSLAIALLRELGKYDPTLQKKADEAQARLDANRERKKSKAKKPAHPAHPRQQHGTRRTQAVEGGGTTVNMTVNAHHTESFDHTMKRVDFRLRNRSAYLAPH